MPHSTTRSTPDASAVRRIDPVLYRLRMLSRTTTTRSVPELTQLSVGRSTWSTT